jgi:UDP-glucose:(heptosyl)LPS alpha-1,3-glucosyltransferase
MRIAVVTPDYHRTGGTERGLAELVTRLAQSHSVCLFASHWEPDGTPNFCFHPVPAIPGPGFARFFSFYWAATRAVRAAERNEGPYDTVYSPGPNCAQVEVCTAWFCQARQHELLASGRLRPRPARIGDWLRLLHRRVYAASVARLERSFYRSPRLQRVVSPAEVLKADLVECYGITPERIVVGHSGVDSAAFSPERRDALRPQARLELGMQDGVFYFLFVGTDWVRKGLLTVFEALPAVPQAQLLVVGAEDAEAWRRASARFAVADRVRYLPRRADILYYYAAADALVAPSVYEPFGLMPLEAMACGLPSIITRLMGVAELVGADEALILDDASSAQELGRAMRALATDRAQYARLVQAGIARARAHSWDGMCNVTIEQLLAVAERKQAVQLEEAIR